MKLLSTNRKISLWFTRNNMERYPRAKINDIARQNYMQPNTAKIIVIMVQFSPTSILCTRVCPCVYVSMIARNLIDLENLNFKCVANCKQVGLCSIKLSSLQNGHAIGKITYWVYM